MSRKKLMYILAFSVFIGKIVLELSRDGDITWPFIGMMWCLASLANETELIKIKLQIEELINKLNKDDKDTRIN